MTNIRNCFRGILTIPVVLTIFNLAASADKNNLPPFGRDTVLVWKSQIGNMKSSFVVRIASFSPDRFVEWESENNQGTVFMPSRDLVEAKDYVSRDLFEGGVDKRSKKNTTLWLSQRIYLELKSKGKAKCRVDGVGATFEYLGRDNLTVEVNGTPRELAVIKASDGRGDEFWFLDQVGNPLMVKHAVRNYTQTLSVISTDRHNTLRWIKGKKLTNPPQKQ
jgi:hypothetical protein